MKFRKKPIVIEAEQFQPWNKPWPAGVEERSLGGDLKSLEGESIQWIIQTLEGPHIVSVNDWIITGVQGEKYPCKPDIFEATYERVEGE